MASRIEDYAIIGDLQTCALIARDGSIDWLCVPCFDSPACFAALLGRPEHGRWVVAPREEIRSVTRRYRGETLILETEFETASGRVRVIDFMPIRTKTADLVRIVEGIEGTVPMRMELEIRFDYGSVVPWVRAIDRGIRAIAGPDTVYCRGDVEMHGEGLATVSEFEVKAGQRVALEFIWMETYGPAPEDEDAEKKLRETEQYWCDWSSRCTYDGPWRDAVVRSLITLKALTYAPTGGLVAAATTSLPERLGGVRNWDYRYCWLRDATFSLYSLIVGGYTEEAQAWREWLVHAVAGRPEELQIMYGIRGERRLTELELDWLPGYENSRPVRVGNAAYQQYQLDVYGELMDVLHLTRRAKLPADGDAWRVQSAIMKFLEKGWKEPDEGIWEVRGPRRHFTHSKVMAWVAFDRSVAAIEQFGLEGPVERWRAIREEIRDEVLERGFDPELNAFVQYYGSRDADASLLMLPSLGFIDANDPRMVGTVALIRKQLECNGFVRRYPADPGIDGLPPGEGEFLLCTFWLADVLTLQGAYDEAREIFERLLSLRNDVGLLAEQYDSSLKRQLGNFPQAFSHVGLINTARNLHAKGGPAEDRKNQGTGSGA
ncbi:MAG TPA: glycoside hydrolase family 15 protein [Thermoanaerobaculia bacterium]|nr:glycoside hydrolase family 15 protein [Thermoanaerobaculia bacterium]